jgi:hypothetical protein
MSRRSSRQLTEYTKVKLPHFIVAVLVMACNMQFIGGLLLLSTVIFASSANAYQLEGQKWPRPTTTFYVDISGANGLWNTSFETAMYSWGADTVFTYNIVRGVYEDPCDPYEGRNGVDFGSTFCGEAWGGTTLAITQRWFLGATLTQTDIVFNKNESWNVYSTAWQSWPWFGVSDFQRVAVHELGHALGLDHEDSGVPTIMKTYIGNTTTPQPDDVGGVAAIYGVTKLHLTVTKSGTGTVTSAPEGISCGTDCSQDFNQGTRVTLVAQADLGSTFTSWTGCDAVYENVCTITMNVTRSVAALFTDAFDRYFDTVQKVYIGYYQRPADPGGLLYWAGRLAATIGDLNEIIEAYANSAESQALYGAINSTTIGNVVEGIYMALFDRPAEEEGKAYYVNGFSTGRFTAATIMLNVLYGAQNQDLLSVTNKLAASNLFTGTIDPNLDGYDFQVTYAGEGDAISGRQFLTPVTGDSWTVPTQDETTAYMKSNIADSGDPILSR